MPNNSMKYANSIIKAIATFFILLIYTNSYCQFDDRASCIPPSPNAASIMKYANTPVNLYTGIPSVSASLHNLSARGGYSIPIDLYYQASGIKVQDIASSVGIGWSLSTNSAIIRVVRGLPDENANGYFGSTMGEKILHPLDATTLNGIYEGTLDAEPDLFFYNVNGKFGKFVFNKSANPVMLSDNSMRIINSPFKKELGIDGWIMEDLQGNMYYLGTDAGSVEDTHSTAHGENSNNATQDFRSTWYLNKIITPNNTETIHFNYDTGDPITITNYSNRHKERRKLTTTYNGGFSILGFSIVPATHGHEEETVDADTWSNNTDELVSAPKYLSSITTSNQNAYFYYDLANARQDLPNGKILKKIEIKDYKNESIKYFVFNQDYIYSKDIDRLEDMTTGALNFIVFKINNGNQTEQSTAFSQLQALQQLKATIDVVTELQYQNQLSLIMGGTQVQTIPDSPEKYRLRLNDITMLSNDQNSSIPLFRFQYKNDINLPPRYSRKMDHWGYYNNNVYGDFPNDNPDLHLIASDPNSISNIMRLPDPQKMQANILQKIIYETGAYKDLVLEANQYYDPVSHTNQNCGGLRVVKIINVGDVNTSPVVTEYKYADDSGNSFGKLSNPPPIYVTTIEHIESQIAYYHPHWTPPETGRSNSNVVNPTYLPPTDIILPPAPVSLINWNSLITAGVTILLQGITQTHTSYTPFFIRSTVSFNNILDLDGVAVGYSKVIVENNGEGKTINSFTDRDDYPDLSNQIMVDASFNSQGRISPNMAPFTPPTSYAFARGRLKESDSYNQSGVLLKRITNTYALQTTNEIVTGFKVAMGKINTLNGAFQSYHTEYYNVGYYDMMSQSVLLTSSKEENFEVGYSSPITQTINYTYNNTYPMLVSSQTGQNSTGDNVLTTFKYVIDKDQVNYSNQPETDAANQLFSDRKYGLLLQKVTQKNNVVINTNLIGYKNWTINGSSLTLPETIYQGFGSNIMPIRKYYSYDVYANPLVFSDNNGIKISNVYNYNNLYPVAEIKNTQYNEFFYEDFENNTSGNILSGNAHSGSHFYNGQYQVNFPVINNRLYKIYYWYHLNGTWVFSGLIPYIGPSMLLNQGDAVDDIIIKPIDAQISSVTYDPLLGVTSKTDVSRSVTKYSYDSFQRLTDIKDNNGNIVKHYDYNLSSTPLPQVYLSALITGNIIKNGCIIGNGSKVPYTVPANRFYSFTSQEDANIKAQTNAQNYANIHGSCLVYARLEFEGYSTFNNTPQYNFHSQHAFVRFYQDQQCTISAALPINTDIQIDYDELDDFGYYQDLSTAYNYTLITAHAGDHQIDLGQINLDVTNYTDTTKSVVDVYRTFRYYIEDNNLVIPVN